MHAFPTGIVVHAPGLWVDAKRPAEVVLRHVVLLLAVVDRSEAVPGVVVPPVSPDRHSEASHGLRRKESTQNEQM